MTCVRTKQIDGPIADVPYAKRRDRGKGEVDERSIPPFHTGPFLAKFSPIWLGRISQQGYRSEVIHKMHKKYGLSHFQPFITL
jgi:hypothetical protein